MLEWVENGMKIKIYEALNENICILILYFCLHLKKNHGALEKPNSGGVSKRVIPAVNAATCISIVVNIGDKQYKQCSFSYSVILSRLQKGGIEVMDEVRQDYI